ncbi:hypothetical protein J6590_035739 [Homalodisca vitripennis]|nr:hypothetical protein J6590_035739 [Homalodisca vitripennis]
MRKAALTKPKFSELSKTECCQNAENRTGAGIMLNGHERPLFWFRKILVEFTAKREREQVLPQGNPSYRTGEIDGTSYGGVVDLGCMGVLVLVRSKL